MHGISCCVACTSNDYMMLGAWPYGANSHVMTCLRSLVVKKSSFLDLYRHLPVINFLLFKNIFLNFTHVVSCR